MIEDIKKYRKILDEGYRGPNWEPPTVSEKKILDIFKANFSSTVEDEELKFCEEGLIVPGDCWSHSEFTELPLKFSDVKDEFHIQTKQLITFKNFPSECSQLIINSNAYKSFEHFPHATHQIVLEYGPDLPLLQLIALTDTYTHLIFKQGSETLTNLTQIMDDFRDGEGYRPNISACAKALRAAGYGSNAKL